MDKEKVRKAIERCNELGVKITDWAYPEAEVLVCKIALRSTSPKNMTEAFNILRDVSVDIDNVIISGDIGGVLINGGAETVELLFGKDFRAIPKEDLSDLVESIVRAERIREGHNEKINEEDPQ